MFTEQDRLIFGFEVLGVRRYADPLEVRHALLRASRGEFDQLSRDAAGPPPEPDGKGGFLPPGPEDPAVVLAREDARARIHAVTCEAFGLPPFDKATGEGLTRSGSAALLDAFLDFLEGKGKPAANSPGSSAATASSPAGPSTTPPSSASC